VVNGKIYAIGGSVFEYTGLSVVEEYDPATDTWTQKADMPTRRLSLATSVVDGIIYAIGGNTEKFTQRLRTVEAYDPLTDTWTTKADMHTGRGALSTGVVDGKIYAIGGGGSSADVVFSTVEEYDPATDTWTTITNMPEPRFVGLAANVVNGKIYLFGGRNGNYISSTVEEYDPATNTWTRKSDLPAPRAGAGSSVVNGRIYVIGGTYVARVHPGVRTVYEYDPNPLVVDFNGDGIVDCADICMMLDYWETDESFYDIAPRPFGDGIVDVQDLIVLAEHLFEEVKDPTLVAHWKLDETEGDIAYDSAVADAVWQPEGGHVDGALQLDGIDDYVSTDFILNPADGAFSIFAWIKGGGPGQVIISQANGAGTGRSWLCTDLSEGKLMTKLEGIGRGGNALYGMVPTESYTPMTPK
jgi:N-acetylneuraminic acid mutarotase